MKKRRFALAAAILSGVVLSSQLMLPNPAAAMTCGVRKMTVELDIFNFVTGADVKSRYRISGTYCWDGKWAYPTDGDPILTFISGSRAGLEQKGWSLSPFTHYATNWVNLRYTVGCPAFPFPSFHYVWWYPRISVSPNGVATYYKGSVDYGGAACIYLTPKIISY